ncbi:MAG: 50S ribosomal protein L35 [Elusimicrobiota bacterium]|jgi:large subunit ribosomal protein L35|nr:50S ribosomal protein L35 [Elusimicrobiota bacterium]
MPKMKTHSGSKKRFKVTAGKKVKYRKSGQRHLMTGDSGNQNRKSRKPAYADKTDMQRLKQLLPYNF